MPFSKWVIRHPTLSYQWWLVTSSIAIALARLSWPPALGRGLSPPRIGRRLEPFRCRNSTLARKSSRRSMPDTLDISVDSIPSHIAWRQKDIGLVEVPLASDFYPHAEVTRKFGILRECLPVPGISERAAFAVDTSGKIAFAKVYPNPTNFRISRIY